MGVEVLFVFFSSSYVYSGHSNLHSYEESEMLDPSHNFGIAKLFFEKYITKCHKNSVILRLSNVYGYGNQLNRTTLKEWIDAGLSNKDLIVWGEGFRKLQYVYIDDVINILMSCKALSNGVFNLGGDEHTKIHELTAYLSEVLDTKVINLLDKSEGETLPLLNTEKLKSKLLNFRFTSLKAGIRQYIEKVKNNG